MIIRAYRPTDFPQVIELWKETGIYDKARGDTAESILQCNARGGKFLILEDDHAAIVNGTCWMTYDGRRLHLHHFVVRRNIQKQGWGRNLLHESLNIARQWGCPVKLEVHRENRHAIHLYTKSGFKQIPGYHVYLNINPGEPLHS
jgi:ribosomal protein S18 acetylase RimI-like enzyme